MSAGTCRHCGCTAERPCDGGCAWTDDTRTLCSRCAFGEQVARVFLEAIQAVPRPGHIGPSDPLPSVFVMTCRAVMEAVREEFLAAIGEEAASAAVELGQLAAFLYERFPTEMETADAADKRVVDVVVRLLEPRRIVLPGGVL